VIDSWQWPWSDRAARDSGGGRQGSDGRSPHLIPLRLSVPEEDEGRVRLWHPGTRWRRRMVCEYKCGGVFHSRGPGDRMATTAGARAAVARRVCSGSGWRWWVKRRRGRDGPVHLAVETATNQPEVRGVGGPQKAMAPNHSPVPHSPSAALSTVRLDARIGAAREKPRLGRKAAAGASSASARTRTRIVKVDEVMMDKLMFGCWPQRRSGRNFLVPAVLDMALRTFVNSGIELNWKGP